MEKIIILLKEFWWVGMMGAVGVVILGYGVWGIIKPSEVKVEIIKGDPSRSDLVGFEKDLQPTRSDLLITVDVAGAVEKPGVYKFPSGSRIGDALVMAGGLGEKADRDWVAKTINLAEIIKDGGKIYIPEIQAIGILGKSDSQTARISESQSGKVNINMASMGELDGLDGIGEVRARLIMDNRPYGKIEDLVEKAKIPQSVYENIKDRLTIY